MRLKIATLLALPFMFLWYVLGTIMILLSILIDGIMGYAWTKEGI